MTQPEPATSPFRDRHPDANRVFALAKDWADVASGDKSIVMNSEPLRLAAVWIGFNALYSLHADRHGERDRDSVLAFAATHAVAERHKHLMGTDSNYRSAVETLLAASPITNHYYREEKVSVTSPEDVQQVLAACYVIRGNLIHGHKMPADDRDRKLVDAAYHVILPMVNHFSDWATFASLLPASTH